MLCRECHIAEAAHTYDLCRRCYYQPGIHRKHRLAAMNRNESQAPNEPHGELPDQPGLGPVDQPNLIQARVPEAQIPAEDNHNATAEECHQYQFGYGADLVISTNDVGKPTITVKPLTGYYGRLSRPSGLEPHYAKKYMRRVQIPELGKPIAGEDWHELWRRASDKQERWLETLISTPHDAPSPLEKPWQTNIDQAQPALASGHYALDQLRIDRSLYTVALKPTFRHNGRTYVVTHARLTTREVYGLVRQHGRSLCVHSCQLISEPTATALWRLGYAVVPDASLDVWDATECITAAPLRRGHLDSSRLLVMVTKTDLIIRKAGYMVRFNRDIVNGYLVATYPDRVCLLAERLLVEFKQLGVTMTADEADRIRVVLSDGHTSP